MKEKPTYKQKTESLIEAIKKEMETLTINYQIAMERMFTALNELNKNLEEI